MANPGVNANINLLVFKKCCAIKKDSYSIPINNINENSMIEFKCKSKVKDGSVLCGVHRKHKPIYVVIENELLLFTNENSIILEIQKKKEAIEILRIETELKELELFNAIKTCSVCFEDVANNSDLIRCDKANPKLKHLVCKECVSKHLELLMLDGIGTNVCMFDKGDNCSGQYSNKDIDNILVSPEIKSKWADLVNINDIFKLASICDDYIICPLCCKWGCIFEVPPGVQINFFIPCGNCNLQWCNVCKRRSHLGKSCYTLEFTDSEKVEKRISIIDHMIQEIVSKTLTHCCSTCGCTYIKEEGCNLMVCPKCEAMSCYLCNMKLYYKNNTKYWHFAGHEFSDPGTYCELWNNKAGDGKEHQGNTEYNIEKIRNELLLFLKSNGDNIKVLIAKRIIHIFEKDKQYNKITTTFKDIMELYGDVGDGDGDGDGVGNGNGVGNGINNAGDPIIIPTLEDVFILNIGNNDYYIDKDNNVFNINDDEEVGDLIGVYDIINKIIV